jgi:hypothetical protein
MEQHASCHQDPNQLVGHVPFTRILALDYYDGPTGGVLQCGGCGAEYRFDMLDWDTEQEVRIFRLAGLPNESMAECVGIISPSEPPHWPIWFPLWRWPNSQGREAAESALQRILARAHGPELVVAWARSDGRVLAAAKLDTQELSQAPDWFNLNGTESERDWFSWLGLSKEHNQLPGKPARPSHQTRSA